MPIVRSRGLVVAVSSVVIEIIDRNEEVVCSGEVEDPGRAAELGWPVDVSISVSKINLDEIADVYAAAVLSQAKCIQINPTMVEGKMRKHPELALTPVEWENVKKNIQAIPNGGVPRCFSDEILCHCRFQSTTLQQVFGTPSTRLCPAGRSFGVIGPSGLFRKCLHTVKNLAWR